MCDEDVRRRSGGGHPDDKWTAADAGGTDERDRPVHPRALRKKRLRAPDPDAIVTPGDEELLTRVLAAGERRLARMRRHLQPARAHLPAERATVARAQPHGPGCEVNLFGDIV